MPATRREVEQKAEVRKRVGDRSNLVVAAAAALAGENGLVELAGDLEAAFDRFMAETPPKVLIYYGVTREPCYGLGLIQRNMDFRRAPYLQKLKHVIEADYRPVLVIDGPCDRIELFGRLDEKYS